MIERLLAHWGYVAIAIGTAVEGEAVVTIGATLAHRGTLDLEGVALAALIGSFSGDQCWYWLGRRFGARALASHPRWAARAERVTQRMHRWGDAYVVAFRFLYGLRTISPVLLGSSGYPPLRFAALDFVGAALWSVAGTAVGWALGSALQTMLGRMARIEELLALGALLLVLGLAGRRLFVARLHRPGRGAESSPGPPPPDHAPSGR